MFTFLRSFTFFLNYQIVSFIFFIGKLTRKVFLRCMNLITDHTKKALFSTPSYKKNTKTYWFLTAAEGEITSLQSIIKKIQIDTPTARVVISTTPGAPEKFARTLFPEAIIAPFTYDSLASAFVHLRTIRPDALIFNISRLYPNLVLLAPLFNCKVYGLNTREKAGKRLSWHTRTIYSCFDAFFSPHKELIQAIAPHVPYTFMPASKINNTLEKKQLTYLVPQSHSFNKFVLLVGSLHHDELDVYLKLYSSLKNRTHPYHIIIVPRYLDWQQKLTHALDSIGCTYTVLTKKDSIHEEIATSINKYDITVIAQMGVLFDLYQYANIFYLGGTFNTIGGHSAVEPAAWQLPIVSGPNLCAGDNPEAVALRNQQGIISCNDATILANTTSDLLTHKEKRKSLSINCYRWLQHENQHSQKAIQKFLSHLAQ